jgi:hypothetical protein
MPRAITTTLSYYFYAAQKVDQLKPGQLAIQNSPRKLLLEYQPQTLQVLVEAVSLEDGALRGNWGERIYRVVFQVVDSAAEGACEFRFRPQE